jgi:hypothetical protein
MLAELHTLDNRIYYLRICTLFVGGVKETPRSSSRYCPTSRGEMRTSSSPLPSAQARIQLLHQHPFTAHGVEYLQQQGSEQFLRRHGRPTHLRIHGGEQIRQLPLGVRHA